MLRALLILSVLTNIVSTQTSGKGFRTVIHSSFPIEAPLQFDPNNDERLVLSIFKPSSDVSHKADDKHRLRIINIDHKLGQKTFSSDIKRTQSDSEVSVSALLTNRDGSTRSKSAAETEILTKQPVIDYGLPKINLKDDLSFAASPETKFVSQKLGSLGPKDSRLFVSKIPSAEELLEKGYVLTDIYPLEFTSDDSEFEFPSDRFFRLPPNNADSELRAPAKSFSEFKSLLLSNLSQNKNESHPELQPKINSANTDVSDVTVRPLEVKYNFLPKTNQAEFHLGKTYISKFLSPAVAYERPGTERESFDIRRTPSIIKNKQGISIQQPVEKENAEIVSLTSKSTDEAAGSNTKTQEIPHIKYTLPSNDKNKKAFITSLFGDSTDDIGDVKSRLASSDSRNLQNTKTYDTTVYQNRAANEKGALADRVSLTSGIQKSSLLSSTSENSNNKSKFDIKTPSYRQELKEYSVPSSSNEERIFSSKLDEASDVKDVTSSSSAISNFQKQSIVKTQKAFSSNFGIASSESGNIKYVTEKYLNSKPEEFAIYYKTPSSSLQGKYGLPKSEEYSRKPFRYVPEQFQSNTNLPYESLNIKHFASFNAEEEKASGFQSGATIKSFEGFLKPEEFAIYYKRPSTQSGENSGTLPTRSGVPRGYEYFIGEDKDQQTHSFLGVPSIPTSSYHLFEDNLKTPSKIFGAPHIPVAVQSSSLPVSAGYELPIANSDTNPIFLTASESKYSGNSEKVSIIYQPSSVKPGGKLNITPPSTSYGTPSPSLSSNIDIRRKLKPINKPFAEYGLPTVKPPSTTSDSPGDDNQHSDIDIRTISDSHVVILKPFLDHGTPNAASTFTNIRTPSGRLSQMKQKFEKKTYEFGVPVLKVPDTRPLSSYEVPVY